MRGAEKTYDTLQNTWIKQSKHLHRYKQALEEIKEIAEVSNMLPCLKVYDYSECANCRDALTSYGELCMQYGLYKILQKCEDISSESKET